MITDIKLKGNNDLFLICSTLDLCSKEFAAAITRRLKLISRNIRSDCLWRVNTNRVS